MKNGKEIKLTEKESEIMTLLWREGPMSVRQMLEFYPEPKPHFNTVSTTVRAVLCSTRPLYRKRCVAPL